MIVQNQLYPSSDTIASLLADVSDKRIVMLNLLKFRPHAAYHDGRQSDLTGREAYWLYADAMQKIVAREGAGSCFQEISCRFRLERLRRFGIWPR
jgi:hypothetical protein